MSAQVYSYWPLTNSMEHSPSWEPTWSATSQAFPFSWLYWLVHCHIYKRLPPVPILSEIMQSMPPHPTSWRSILLLFSHLYLGLPSGLFPSGLLSPIHGSCSTHLILLDFIMRVIFGEVVQIMNLLHFPTLLLPHLSSVPVSQHPVPKHPLCERQSFTPRQNDWQNCSSVYFNLDIFG